jgi:hypothetical protein
MTQHRSNANTAKKRNAHAQYIVVVLFNYQTFTIHCKVRKKPSLSQRVLQNFQKQRKYCKDEA